MKLEYVQKSPYFVGLFLFGAGTASLREYMRTLLPRLKRATAGSCHIDMLGPSPCGDYFDEFLLLCGIDYLRRHQLKQTFNVVAMSNTDLTVLESGALASLLRVDPEPACLVLAPFQVSALPTRRVLGNENLAELMEDQFYAENGGRPSPKLLAITFPHIIWDTETKQHRLGDALCEALGTKVIQQLADGLAQPTWRDLREALAAHCTMLVSHLNAPSRGGDDQTLPPPTHSADFTSVDWFGTKYQFSKTQAACVKVLWEEWERGGHSVGQETIAERVAPDSGTFRLDHRFRNHGKMHPAWNTMIKVCGRGVFALVEPNHQ